jgi:hypothetical protein
MEFAPDEEEKSINPIAPIDFEEEVVKEKHKVEEEIKIAVEEEINAAEK